MGETTKVSPYPYKLSHKDKDKEMADNSTQTIIRHNLSATAQEKLNKKKAGEQYQKEHAEFVANEENWEYVDIPDTDLFDQPFGYISINLEQYGPGRHFVDPDVAGELRRILKVRTQSDLRIYRPTADKKMLEIMARQGKPLTSASSGTQMDVPFEPFTQKELETGHR